MIRLVSHINLYFDANNRHRLLARNICSSHHNPSRSRSAPVARAADDETEEASGDEGRKRKMKSGGNRSDREFRLLRIVIVQRIEHRSSATNREQTMGVRLHGGI